MAAANPWSLGTASATSFPRSKQPHTCSRLFSSKNPVNATFHRTTGHNIRSNPNLSCYCSGNNENRSSDWDWSRWTRHFSEIEQTEKLVSLLKYELKDAIEKEDFEAAAKLKISMEEAKSMDSVFEIMSLLKNAIEEERYHDASRLCKKTGSGLVGWWVGCSKDSHDPFGRLVHITPSLGRFIGRSYTPRQLVTAAPGTPLFEIYVIKDADGTYNLQAVYLQREKGSLSGKSAILMSTSAKSLQTPQIENAFSDIETNKDRSDKSEVKGLHIEGATEEGIRSVIKFLKDKIPGLKIKVMDVDAVNKLMQQGDEKLGSSESSANEASNSDVVQPDRVFHEGDDIVDKEKNPDMNLFVGGVLPKDETPTKTETIRLPAEVKDIGKDSFVLHVTERSHDNDTEERKMSNFNMADLVAQGVSELMPPDVAKSFLNVERVPSTITRDVREIVKLAVSQAQKRTELSACTSFCRVITSGGNLDPFDGLFVGAFGPYGTEVVQLRRKFGCWNGSDDKENASDVELFEYVEAVKLTGDLNVPAGQVTFRAKIGKGNRTSNRELYPDELGVLSSHRGQGRIAEFGFQNPRWVDGELLQLSGRSIGPYVQGADLGFLYIVPEQSFLVLFNRLKLTD